MSGRGGCFIGASLSCTDLLVYLYDRVLRVSPDTAADPGRDFLLLSKGHDVPALYGALAERGYFDRARLDRHLDPRDHLYWHPNRHIPGVEFHSGSLGHLLSVGMGIALDARLARHPQPGVRGAGRRRAGRGLDLGRAAGGRRPQAGQPGAGHRPQRVPGQHRDRAADPAGAAGRQADRLRASRPPHRRPFLPGAGARLPRPARAAAPAAPPPSSPTPCAARACPAWNGGRTAGSCASPATR